MIEMLWCPRYGKVRALDPADGPLCRCAPDLPLVPMEPCPPGHPYADLLDDAA